MSYKLNLKISEVAGRNYDILTAGHWLYFKDDYLNSYKELNLPLDKDVESSVNYIIKNIELPSLKLDILFKENNGSSFVAHYFNPLLWDYISTNDFLESISKINPTEFIKDIINFFDEDKRNYFGDYTVSGMTTYLEQTSMSDEIKYKLLVLSADPANLVNTLFEFFNCINEKITVIYNKFNRKIIDFRLSIEKPSVDISEEIFDIIASSFVTVNEYSNFDTAQVAISFLNDIATINVKTEGKEIYAVIGTSFKTLVNSHLEKSRLSSLDFLAVTKALSDKTRLEILEMLITKGMYTSEISDNLNMPFPKALYHINILAESKIISSYSQGKRVYYEINKDFFLYLSEFIKRKYCTKQ